MVSYISAPHDPGPDPDPQMAGAEVSDPEADPGNSNSCGALLYMHIAYIYTLIAYTELSSLKKGAMSYVIYSRFNAKLTKRIKSD